jgi:hypothetical protein
MIKSFHIILVALLGEQHYLARQDGQFVTALDQPNFFKLHSPAESRREVWPGKTVTLHTSTPQSVILGSVGPRDPEAASTVPLPPLNKPLRMMVVDNMSWLPKLNNA